MLLDRSTEREGGPKSVSLSVDCIGDGGGDDGERAASYFAVTLVLEVDRAMERIEGCLRSVEDSTVGLVVGIFDCIFVEGFSSDCAGEWDDCSCSDFVTESDEDEDESDT